MKKLIFKKITKDISIFFLISIISVSIIVWIIQAVNFLDLISEDGHSLKIYFSYTLFSLPKIISKILPFIFMISIFYVIIKYELNNELIIYWINGISKLNFVNVIIKISFLFFVLQIFLTSVIVPYTLDKGRSFFRSSNVDLFSSIIKEKKFIDTVENLTIFVESKENNILKNIIIKEKIDNKQSQIIVAESGKISDDNQSSFNKQIVLNNGKIINTDDKKQNIINFTKFSLDLSKFNTKTTTHPKIQEMSSINLFNCIEKISDFKNYSKENSKIYEFKNVNTKSKQFFIGCNIQINNAIFEEVLKRFFAPLFILLIGITSALIINSTKDERSYRFKNFMKFNFGIFFIILSEILLRYSSLGLSNMIIYFLIPFIFFIIIYLSFYFNNKNYGRYLN